MGERSCQLLLTVELGLWILVDPELSKPISSRLLGPSMGWEKKGNTGSVDIESAWQCLDLATGEIGSGEGMCKIDYCAEKNPALRVVYRSCMKSQSVCNTQNITRDESGWALSCMAPVSIVSCPCLPPFLTIGNSHIPNESSCCRPKAVEGSPKDLQLHPLI